MERSQPVTAVHTRARGLRGALAAAAMVLSAWSAQATVIRLEAPTISVSLGGIFDVRVVADIDPADEIIGFGFDWQADPGLVFLGALAGPGFADDPTYLAPFSDSDGIRGASGGSLLFGGPVSGLNVLLGVLQVQATALGSASIGLGADDLAFNFTEGLIPLSPNLVNFMPSVIGATINVVQGPTRSPSASSGALTL